MTKEKQYKEISKLFPSELGVGDVVKHNNTHDSSFITYFMKIIYIDSQSFSHLSEPFSEVILVDTQNNDKCSLYTKDVKIWVKRKNISLGMVLRKFEEVRKFHTHLDINSKGYLTYWESGDEMNYDKEDDTKQVDWILRKDGKDCSLYDQIKHNSKVEDLFKLIMEVLK